LHSLAAEAEVINDFDEGKDSKNTQVDSEQHGQRISILPYREF
jgi:hypothetical protein